jgi:Carboxypeptidase regulatory-like domain/TonB dependent receptor
MHSSSSQRGLRITACVLALCAVIGCPVFSQSTGGRILGRVADPSGAVLGDVTVHLTNNATGAARNIRTNGDGDYVFVEVAPGTYTAEFEHPGFKKTVQKDVTVEVNQVVTLNSTLQLGQAKEVVEVTSEAPLVDLTSTQLGAVVNDRSISQLPLAERNTYQFLSLQPGVQSTTGGDLFYGSDRAGVVSVNGGRGRSNNFSVNGGDANDQFANLPAIQPTPDAIEEFRVLTNTFDAEYGRNSGAIVNVVTKSGTNAFHGNVYEFFRNRSLNAKGYFDTEKPTFIQNEFGGTFGGPIAKDRTFFFASYEGERQRRGISSGTVSVPTDAERLGDFSEGFATSDPNFPVFSGTLTNAFALNQRAGCPDAVGFPGGIPDGVDYVDLFPGNQIPLECMDPTAVDLMNQFIPHANVGEGLFSSVPVQRLRNDQFTFRFDHRINQKQQFSAYYYFNDDNLAKPFAKFQAGGGNIPGFGDHSLDRFQQWNLSHTWTISNSLVNEFRFNYFRQAQGTFLHPQRTHLVTDSCTSAVPAGSCFSDPSNPKLGITPNLGPDREGVPFISIGGGPDFGNNFEGELPQIGNSFQWTDNLTKVKGNHTMKFGADLRRQRFDQRLYFDINGDFTFTGASSSGTGFGSAIPDYLLGFPDSYLQGSAQTENVRSTIFALFAQDSWKIKPNITLNYGLRWELDTPLTDISHRVQTFRPGQNTTIYPCELSPASVANFQDNFGVANPDCENTGMIPTGLVVPGDQGVPAGLTQTYYRAFAPRIGIAYSPGSSGKTSIRAGWGLFYNPIEQLVLEQFSAEPPFGGSSLFYDNLFNLPFLNQDGVTVSPNPFNGILNPQPGNPVDWSTFRPIILYGQFQPNLRTQYSAQYNLSIQRELSRDMVFQIGYVGSQGHRLLATHDLNFGNAQTCLDLQNISDLTGDGDLECGQYFADSPFFVPTGEIPSGVTLHLPYGSIPSVTGPNLTDITLVGLRPYSSPNCEPTTGAGCPVDGLPMFSSIFAQDTIAHSNYNSLQMSLEKRFARGLQLQAAYTFSKSIDNASSFENILDPTDFSRSRSLSLFDARHRFVLSYYWDLPIPKKEGFAGKLLNGWSVSGITTFQSGFPIRILSEDDNELMYSFDFELPGRPDLVGKFTTRDPHFTGCEPGTSGPGCPQVPNQYFDPNAFAPAALGTLGTAPRTLCCGPGINSFDVSLLKTTSLTENKRLEFRAEFFNIANHTQFFQPEGDTSNGSDFGRISRAKDPRLIEFAVKLFF